MRVSTAGMEQRIALLRDRAPQAIARALNRAGTSGRAYMTQQITKDTGLTSKHVKREILIEKGREFINLVIRGARLPLIAFGAKGPEPSRGRGRGVTYRLPSGRGRIPDAFIARMRSGHRGVFKRSPRSGRLPIFEPKGPSLPHVFTKYLPGGCEHAGEALSRNLAHEMEFALKR